MKEMKMKDNEIMIMKYEENDNDEKWMNIMIKK